ncbi:hypothetical protein D1B32_23565 [Oceanobacillus profundus]|uniref:Reverse transcriptase RNase H-like domain-containing protein n=1 Tax=Oceanobacillus profundus TaxID=372463 RepID=A0A417Y9J6_9BACI|nr:hypothetical protein D1B32_23565 [Oceanobacillus profundus]
MVFSSHALSAQEHNYQVADKEMLAIIRALEMWRHYLEGARHKFEIWSDHKNLNYFMSSQDLNRRQARWALYLSRFDFTLIHKPGTSMTKADALSRRVDHAKGIESDNSGITLIKPEWIRAQHIVVEAEEGQILDRIRSQSSDLDLRGN